MSIWKSPVFYFGVVLLLVVITAVLAPFVVDWDRYKPDLEAYGQKLTGRAVEIDGGVAVRLFPWPRLEANNISIANDPAFGDAPLLAADKIVVKLSLAGLFNGTLDVESVAVEKPHLNLIRNADGRMSWTLTPDQSVRNGTLLARVKLDQISVSNGSAWIEDGTRKFSTNLSKLNLNLAARAIEGPWRMRGSGQWGEVPVALGFNSLAYAPDLPFKFGVQVSPTDTLLPAISFDSAWDAQELKGKLRLEPQVLDGAKGSAEGGLRPLSLETQVEASDTRISFDKIKIAPADRKDSGTLIEGYALLEMATTTTAKVLLKSPRVNLDTLVGAESLAQWRDGGLLAVVNSLFKLMPEKLVAEISLDVNVLTSGGQSLNDVRFRGIAERQAIRIREASANMPGRSRAKFDGVLFPASGTAELAGALGFESNDFRAFMAWLSPGQKLLFDENWKGSRGRIKLQTDLTWSGRRLGLQNLDYELDGLSGKAEIALRLGDLPAIDLRLNAKALDIDNFLPQGFSIAEQGNALNFGRLLAVFMDNEDAWEKRLTLAADQLTLNGIVAQDVALDFVSSLSGFEIKTFDIGAVGGARVKAEGLVLTSGEGPAGDIAGSVTAEDVTGLLRLAGIARPGATQPWLTALGATDATFELSVKPEEKGPRLSLKSQGSSGALSFQVDGSLLGVEDLQSALIVASGTVRSVEASQLAKVFGFVPVAAQPGPGKFVFKTSGSPAQGYTLSTTAELFGATLGFDGAFDPLQAYGKPKGQFKISAAEASGWLRAIGLPLDTENVGMLEATAALDHEAGNVVLRGLVGKLGSTAFEVDATMDQQGRINIDAATDVLHFNDVMAWSFLPWSGGAADLTASFADPAASPWRGEIFIRPRTLASEFFDSTGEVVVGLGLEANKKTLSLREPGPDGLLLDMTLSPKGASFEAAGKGRIKLDLAKLMRQADGAVFATGALLLQADFNAVGRSPTAALTAMTAKGNYWITDAILRQLTLKGYASGLAQADTPQQLTDVLNRLEVEPGTGLAEATGNLEIAAGELQLAPLLHAEDGTKLDVATVFDLASAQLASVVTVRADNATELPPVTVTLSGTPGVLKKRSGTSALAAKLGYILLAKEMAGLEALQRQQQAILADEETQRKSDVERFEAFQAQRAELRTRMRELKVLGAERLRVSRLHDARLNEALTQGDAINAAELAARLRQLQILR